MAELKETRASILDTAKKCVCGDREQDYGTPESNFSTIAQLWTAFKGLPFTAVDVAIFLSLVKIGRIASGHGKADNWIDLAGYAACGGEIESEHGKAHRPAQAELEDLFDSEKYVCGLTDVAKGEPVKGKYEGLSNGELKEKICFKGEIDDCEKCPLFIPSGGWDSTMPCSSFRQFRKIAIDWLNKQDGLEGKV